MCSKLINPKEKIEKLQLTNDDIKGKVLHCKKCDYQTPKIKPSKAKQKLSAHEYSRHNKEDLPKDKEVLQDILEITEAGNESYNDFLDVEHVIIAPNSLKNS